MAGAVSAAEDAVSGTAGGREISGPEEASAASVSPSALAASAGSENASSPEAEISAGEGVSPPAEGEGEAQQHSRQRASAAGMIQRKDLKIPHPYDRIDSLWGTPLPYHIFKRKSKPVSGFEVPQTLWRKARFVDVKPVL